MNDNKQLQQLIEHLEEQRQSMKPFWGKDPTPQILEDIGRHKSQQALAALMPWLNHREEVVRTAAAGAAKECLEGISCDQLLSLETQIRTSWCRYYVPEQQEYIAGPQSARLLCSLSSNGRHREKALLEMTSSGDADALPFVMLRLNDWVLQVRTAAEKWFVAYEARISITQLVSCLPILAALGERSRGTKSRVVKALSQRIATEASPAELLQALPRANPRTRSWIFDLLSTKRALDDSAVQTRLMDEPNPIMGLLLMKKLRCCLPALPENVIRQGLVAKSAMLRRSVLYHLTSEQMAERHVILQGCLLDESKSVRQIAQHHFSRRTSSEELRRHYECEISRPDAPAKILAVALLGFHEAGGNWQPSRYAALMNHPSVRVRRAVMTVYGQVHFDEALPWLLAVMEEHADSSLAKVAYGILKKHPQSVTLQRLKDWVNDTSRADRFRHRALALIFHRGKWEKLPVLFELLHASPGHVGHRVESQLRSWLNGYNRSQVQPTKIQIEASRSELQRAEPQLDQRLRQEFRSLLDSVTCR